MISILFVINDLRKGGAETTLINILKYLNPKEFKCTLMLDYLEGELLNEVPKHIKIVSKNKKRYSGFLSNLNKINNLIFEKKPNWLHHTKFDIEIAYIHNKIPSISNSPNSKSKKIGWLHMDISYFTKKEINYLTPLFHNIDQLVCVSTALETRFKNIFKTVDSRVIYNSQNIKNIKKLATEKISKQKSKFTIVTLTRFHRHKGIDRAIKLHHHLLEQNFDNELWIIGSGDVSYKKEIENLIIELDVSDSVHLLGMQINPYPYLKQADVFIMPSHSESFSLTILEALSLNIPVIATKNPGPDEVLDFGKYGLITPNTNEDFIVKASEYILNSTYDLNIDLTERANYFDISKIIPQIEDYFKSIIE